VDFWNTNQPYDIACKITGGNELYKDLVPHVYLIIKDRPAKDWSRLFARVAYQQYYWSESEFNRLYKRYICQDLSYLVTDEHNIEGENEYQRALRDFLDRETTTIEEWYTTELTKMRLSGMTYRAIEAKTKLNSREISTALKIFKHEFTNYHNSNSNNENNT